MQLIPQGHNQCLGAAVLMAIDGSPEELSTYIPSSWAVALQWIKPRAPWAMPALCRFAIQCRKTGEVPLGYASVKNSRRLKGRGILIVRREHDRKMSHAVAYENGRIFDSMMGEHASLAEYLELFNMVVVRIIPKPE